MAIGKTAARYLSQILHFYDKTSIETITAMAPVRWEDDFLGKAIDATNDYTVSIVNSGTFAINAQSGGVGRITTGAADDDDMDVSLGLNWLVSCGLVMEARVKTADIAHTAMNIGWSDAVTEAADLIAMTFATTTLTTTATDAAVFFTDSDATSNVLRAATVNTDVDGTVIAGTTLPVDAAWHIYRVEIDVTGDVRFYYDGNLFGTQLLGVATTALLTPYIAVINREGSANTLDVDYIRAFQLSRS